MTCQFYDRRNAGPAEKGPSWGQCRRTAPMLHPVNVKSYMIEGVWPHVRDDDWCGEWKIVPRRSDARGPLVAPAQGPRVGALAPMSGVVVSGAPSAVPLARAVGAAGASD
jgi:hypothetical protein